jgi:hypothetical protein
MRLNFKHENSVNKNTEKLTKWLFSHVREFGKEYDVSNNVISHRVISDKKLSTLFCSWMSEKGIINMKPYSLVCDDDVVLAVGWEIAEDELLTMRILETS